MVARLKKFRPMQIGLAMASPETRKRVWAAASAARVKAFELYREEKARMKAEAEAKAAQTVKK
jgi:hypothetical protein